MITVALLFIVLGLLVKHAKMHFLIAGYNMMSKEEKAKYDIEGIATLFRNTLFAMAALLLIGSIAIYWFEISSVEHLILIPTIIIGVIYLLVRSNSSRFKINTNQGD